MHTATSAHTYRHRRRHRNKKLSGLGLAPMLDAHAPQVVPTAVALQWLPPTSTVARLHEQLCNNSASHATTETNGQRKARRYHPRSRKGLQRSGRMPSTRLQSCPARVGSHDGCWFPRMVVLVQQRMMRCGAACAPEAGHHTTCTCSADAEYGETQSQCCCTPYPQRRQHETISCARENIDTGRPSSPTARHRGCGRPSIQTFRHQTMCKLRDAGARICQDTRRQQNIKEFWSMPM